MSQTSGAPYRAHVLKVICAPARGSISGKAKCDLCDKHYLSQIRYS
jgi:hypothetical protein